MIKYFIGVFILDIAIRVFINPTYSPSMTIARFMVRKQTPLYVGAAQKKFALYIGLTAMLVHMVILNSYGPVNDLCCMKCMILCFFSWLLGFGTAVKSMHYSMKMVFNTAHERFVKLKIGMPFSGPL